MYIFNNSICSDSDNLCHRLQRRHMRVRVAPARGPRAQAAGALPLCHASGCQALPLCHASGCRALPLCHASGCQALPLCHASGCQALPLCHASGSKHYFYATPPDAKRYLYVTPQGAERYLYVTPAGVVSHQALRLCHTAMALQWRCRRGRRRSRLSKALCRWISTRRRILRWGRLQRAELWGEGGAKMRTATAEQYPGV
jgi:hypothetical protein